MAYLTDSYSVLTSKGWVRCYNIDMNDLIACYDDSNSRVVWKAPRVMGTCLTPKGENQNMCLISHRKHKYSLYLWENNVMYCCCPQLYALNMIRMGRKKTKMALKFDAYSIKDLKDADVDYFLMKAMSLNDLDKVKNSENLNSIKLEEEPITIEIKKYEKIGSDGERKTKSIFDEDTSRHIFYYMALNAKAFYVKREGTHYWMGCGYSESVE